ncbi:glucuronate isomerase, partial [bacterium]|nr:glucuronate isomerase [bacterium]
MLYLDSPDKLVTALQKTVDAAPIFDLHTHLYAPVFDKLVSWGIDELLTYHYLLAETFRWRRDMDPAEFYSLSKKEQANIVWQTLFVDNSPISESCRGVLTVISKVMAGPVRERSLDQIREYYDSVTAQQYMDIVFQVSGVREVVMTNDPFDDLERPVWDRNPQIDSRFHTALRIDPLLLHWEKLACPRLQSWGYAVTQEITESTAAEVRRFLNDWITKIDPLYVAISLTPDFDFPDDSVRSQLISQC